MKRILFVGEHPYDTMGNSNMLTAILKQMDFTKYQVGVYSRTPGEIPPYTVLPYYLVVNDLPKIEDESGMRRLVQLLASNPDIDAMISIGIDLWRFYEIFKHVLSFSRLRKFKWGAVFPYDVVDLRNDWVKWINFIDFPCVYSRYGYEMLKDHCPNIRYFRPPLNESDLFQSYQKDKREQIRRELFTTIPSDAILLGFVGPNQFRKDPHRLVKAFLEAKKEIPNLYLYMHTQFVSGIYNLQQMAFDYGAKPGDLIIKNQQTPYTRDRMVDIYNCFDMYINCSMQEGLSWTVLEAQLCGVPVIVSDCTAHSELIENNAGIGVPTTELSYIPAVTERGASWIEAKSCKIEDIVEAIKKLALNKDLRVNIGNRGLKSAREWLIGVDNIGDLLADMEKIKERPKKKGVLFVQESSAGDVLMSTQCLKGIKERHFGSSLIYMTRRQYQDIVVGNPYIDEIIDYDEEVIQSYDIVYDPHGTRILPGGFNNLDVTLHSMYPYFCKVEPDDIFIDLQEPECSSDLPSEYIVVHTTGGSVEYRSYKNMGMVVKSLGIPTVQIGGSDDLVCQDVDLDLRGRLTWRETAWVMKNAKAAVVIDSFPSHLAAALAVPVVVLYGPAPARVTRPKGNPELIINLEPNKLDVCPNLTNCWGKPGEQRCRTPCINTITPMRIRKALKELMMTQSSTKEAFGI